jgi:hypothetical protein
MSTASIPYEKQSDSQSNRSCGAACLSMVYRSFGKEVPQEQIAPAIIKPNRFGHLASTTHLMAKDALNRGFCAVAIQARHPLQALRLCQERGIRAILNHRLRSDVATGHYTVMVNLDDSTVVLHDPFFGPSRHVSHSELLDLWRPHFANSEIVGGILIGITAGPLPTPACEFCRTPSLASVECPNCKQPVPLQPGALLGCVNSRCIARMWNYICCPSCDYQWTFGAQPTEGLAPDSPRGPDRPSSTPSPDPRVSPDAPQDPLNLEKLFAELDKFCNHILGLPAAANHPELRRQIDFITSGKERLRLAQIEELAHRKARFEQLAAMGQVAQQREQAHRQRMEELNTPAPPLDGDALGRALLKNLGFTH